MMEERENVCMLCGKPKEVGSYCGCQGSMLINKAYEMQPNHNPELKEKYPLYARELDALIDRLRSIYLKEEPKAKLVLKPVSVVAIYQDGKFGGYHIIDGEKYEVTTNRWKEFTPEDGHDCRVMGRV